LPVVEQDRVVKYEGEVERDDAAVTNRETRIGLNRAPKGARPVLGRWHHVRGHAAVGAATEEWHRDDVVAGLVRERLYRADLGVLVVAAVEPLAKLHVDVVDVGLHALRTVGPDEGVGSRRHHGHGRPGL